MHVNEDALILHYYGEGDDAASVESHLASCPACRMEFEQLRRVLAIVDAQPVPEPCSGVRTARCGRGWSRRSRKRRGAGSRGCSPLVRRGRHGRSRAVWRSLLLAAFVAGRFYKPGDSGHARDGAAPSPTSAIACCVVAVVDHLDRSQMVLIELLNAEPNAFADISSWPVACARDLVAANRLYRQTAAQAGDSVIGEMLDELERVLLEIANAPENVTAEADMRSAARTDRRARPVVPRAGGAIGDARARAQISQQNRSNMISIGG